MKEIKVPVITKPLDLSEYHKSLSGGVIDVWVNPPKSVRRERKALLDAYAVFFAHVATSAGVADTGRRPVLRGWINLLKKRDASSQQKRLLKLEQDVYAWYANLWSQGANPELHWSVEEVEQITDRDPALYQWMIRRSTLMIDAFQSDKKK